MRTTYSIVESDIDNRFVSIRQTALNQRRPVRAALIAFDVSPTVDPHHHRRFLAIVASMKEFLWGEDVQK
jgi:hypothetical protein